MTIYILNKLNWLSIDKLLIFSSVCYIHKIIKLNQPESMIDLFRTKVSNRAITKWYTQYQPKTMQMKNFYIYKALEHFYNIPKPIQNCKHKNFKIKLKNYLKSNEIYVYDSED